MGVRLLGASGGFRGLLATSERDKNHRFAPAIISYAGWLSFRFPRRDRTVEEMLLARGIVMTYEATRKECRKCGQANAHQLKRLQPQLGDTWHLDAVFLPSNGKCHALGRAVDPDDNVLALMQSRRHKQAAKKFVRTLRKGLPSVPRVLIADTLQRYGAAQRESLPGVETVNVALCISGVSPRSGRRANVHGVCKASHPPAMSSVFG